MLIAAQFPLCDLRPLHPEDTGRLQLPPAALGEPGRDFVRGFGPIERRRRGGIDEWAGEEVFCSAARAVKFPHRFQPGPPPGLPGRVSTQCAFRRLLGHGSVSPRIEVGLAIRPIGKGPKGLVPAHVQAVLRWLASLPTEVPLGRQLQFAGPLVRAGVPLGQRYLISTTRTDELDRVDGDLVRAGEPLLFVEYQRREFKRLPDGIERVRALHPDVQIDLAHGRFQHHATTFRVWFLRLGPDHDRDLLRRLRLHLLRLHAERQGVRGVLRATAEGKLPIRAGHEATERLERYLQDTLRLLARRERYGLPQSELLPMAAAYEDLIEPGQAASIVAALRDARASVRTKVREALRVSRTPRDVVYVLHSGEVTMNQFNIKLGDHNVLHGDFVVAQRIQESFNRVAQSDAQADLKQALEDLSRAVAEMATKLSEEDARQSARDLDTLSCEALSPKPRKAWYTLAAESLVETAHRVGEAAGVVTKLVRTVLTLMGG